MRMLLLEQIDSLLTIPGMDNIEILVQDILEQFIITLVIFGNQNTDIIAMHVHHVELRFLRLHLFYRMIRQRKPESRTLSVLRFHTYFPSHVLHNHLAD